MTQVTTIGLDLAKRVFQVHGVDAAGAVVLRRQLKRRQMVPFFTKLPSCLIGMEACGTAHHWGRTLRALGHEVRLIPPAYAKAYVRRNKTDPADAEAHLRGGRAGRRCACPNQERSRPGDGGGGASGARAAHRAAHSDDQHVARRTAEFRRCRGQWPQHVGGLVAELVGAGEPA